MNPYKILNINPTDDKMAIRRAYVQEAKRHHPDNGGDNEQFLLVQAAYQGLINDKFETEIIETDVNLDLVDFMTGCDATVVVKSGPHQGMVFEIKVPPFSYPNTVIKFRDFDSTSKQIRVKLHESQTKQFTRLESNVVIRYRINTLEAELGTTIEVVNFDNTVYTLTVSPETTADRLIYNFDGAGFYKKSSQERGNLTIIVEVDKKRYSYV
jgi:DnaJ-class molecular chaperone